MASDGLGFYPDEAGGVLAGGPQGQAQRNKTRFGTTAAREAGELNRHDFYFDEDKPNFFLKTEDNMDKLYYDLRFAVWRIRRQGLKYNGDWFFHEREGAFLLKDRDQPSNIYYFDTVWNIYKKREVYGPSVNGLLPKDYYYDEVKSEWLRKKGTPEGTFTFDENGWRAAKRIPLTGPDDFYYDEDRSEFTLKEEGKARQYYYDPKFGAWRKIGGMNIRPTGSPSNFYFNEQEGVFKKKDAPRVHFEFDANNHFFRKKKVLEGLHNPKNWSWDNGQKVWSPKQSTRSNIFSQVLHWRPPRDYDKPWLDYKGGQVEQPHQGKETLQAKAKVVEGGKVQGPGYVAASSKPVPGFEKNKKTLDQILKEQAALAEWGEEGFKNSANRISFDSKGPGFVDGKEKSGLVDEEEEIGPIKIEEIVDRSIDRKRLKCGNLNNMLSPKELKAFFVSAKAVLKPKDKHPKDPDDYMYIHFESDQGAAAALKTMQNADIKGQRIVLTYPRRNQI